MVLWSNFLNSDVAISACHQRNAKLFEHSPDNYFKQSEKYSAHVLPVMSYLQCRFCKKVLEINKNRLFDNQAAIDYKTAS